MRNIFITLLLFVLILAGCSQNKTVEEGKSGSATDNKPQTSSSMESLTKQELEKKYSDSAHLNFEDYKEQDGIGFLSFTFEHQDTKYYGFTVAEKDNDKWILNYFEDNKIDESAPISIFQFVGSHPNYSQKNIGVLEGIINKSNINEVVLIYPNNVLNVIKLGQDQQVFLNINLDQSKHLQKIEGKNSKGEVVWEKMIKGK